MSPISIIIVIKILIIILVLGIIALGVIRPLLSRVLVPIGVGAPGEIVTDMSDEIDIDEVEVAEGEMETF